MRPFIDFSSKFSVAATTYGSDDYTLRPQTNKYLIVKEISVAGDSTFLSDCRMAVFIGGNSITSEAGALTEVSPQNSLSTLNKFILAPNEPLEVRFRTTSGTGVVQVMVTGWQLDVEEYNALVASGRLNDVLIGG